MAETWTASYPGLVANRIKSFSYANSVGIRPGTITVTVVGFDHAPAASGDFAFSGSDSDSFVIPDCAYVPRGTNFDFDNPVTKVKLLDRRWAWRYGTIDGVYNRRLENGFVELPKNPQELATLLLDEMGESNYDISELPDAGNPPIRWEKAIPAQALEELCDYYGLQIYLGHPSTGTTYGDRVRLVAKGSGSGIPDMTNERSRSSAGSVGVIPSRIQAAARPTLYACTLELTAVGKDENGIIKPVDDLTYKPSGIDWPDVIEADYVDVGDGETEERQLELQQLAKENVYRLWQVTGVVEGTGDDDLNPPGYDTGLPDLTTRRQLKVKQHTGKEISDAGGFPKLEEAKLRGTFVDPEGFGDTNVKPGTKWPDRPGQSGEGRIIKLGKPALKYDSANDKYVQADLWLEAAVEVEHPELNVPVYYARFRTNTASLAGTLQREFSDVTLRYETLADYTTGSPVNQSTTSNKTDVDTELDYYLDGIAIEFNNFDAVTVEAMGLQRVAIGGDITSIQWSAGNGPPKTKVGQNTEVSPQTMSYEEKKRQDHVEKLAKEGRERNIRLSTITEGIERTA